jgi:hypothetical protein
VWDPMQRLRDVQLVPGGGPRDTTANARVKAADKLPGRHSGVSQIIPNNSGWLSRRNVNSWTRSVGDGSPVLALSAN